MMRILIILFLAWAPGLSAQSYPSYDNLFVNDYAGVLPPADEAALTAELRALRNETGVEMTVLTLPSQEPYAPDQSLTVFATGLFNHWGIGDASRNDGVLILLLTEDRAMRIELGAGYGRDWDRIAESVIDRHFLDPFAAGEFPRGLSEGSAAVIEEIVRPFLAGNEAPQADDEDTLDLWVIAFCLLCSVFVAGRHRIGDALARLRTCPRCGARGLHRSRRTIQRATETARGTGEKRIWCPRCDYDERRSFSISVQSGGDGNSGGGFGGGSSGGGGGSGRF